MRREWDCDEEGGEMESTQIGQRRTFIKLKSFIHFGRWNVYFINALNPMILTQQSQINLDQGPTTQVKLNKSIKMAQDNLFAINQLKNK